MRAGGSIRRGGMLVAAAALLIAGCAPAITRRAPPETPASFESGAPHAPAPTWPGREWYRGFSSGQLDELVQQASARNGDLAQARARVAQADARARIAGAPILPSVDAQGDAAYLAGRSSSGSGHETDWSALLSASYEIDFWGKNRAALRSAASLRSAAKAEREAVALTLLAAVADGYFQVLALEQRMSIAKSNLETAQHVLSVVKARFDAGAAGPIELASQKAALDAAALAISDLAQRGEEARAALALLVGRVPEGFALRTETLDALTEPRVAPGLPADLLVRRPDVFLAESSLAAADADVAVARAAMLPGVTLTAAGGVQNPALNAAVLALPGAGPTLALGGSLTQSIFDHGRLEAQRREAQAKSEELLAAYHGAILAALADTENALAALRHLDEARPYQSEALTESEHAFEGAKLRYQAGSGDYLTLLEAQRSLYGVRDQSVQYRLARLEALVALCKALGGGWTEPT
ncbi:MAG TPA: efflux transporter outer membrane subunit [Steroidobacteraceae bacterium]|nr:efflux transporter outer membrane subunit [Steroidobacteraceae bacterium]